jgi:hypothetical protein
MARSRGPNAPWGTPGGRVAQVEVRHRGHAGRWGRYSSTTGRTGGTSATWWRIGSRSSPARASPHQRHRGGLHSKTWRSCSGGTSGRAWRCRPGCPPRFLPEAGVGGRRLTEGGSDEGGLEELVEFLPSRSSRSAIRPSKDWASAETAAWAAGESVSQMIGGSGGRSVMPMFYRTQDEEATLGLERLLLDYLTRCYQARLDGQPVPSLLATTSDAQAA